MLSQKPKKILIINIFGVGDVLFTTPLISNLKKHWPDCYIGYICNKRTVPLLTNNSKVNKIFIYERDEFQGIYHVSKKKFLEKLYRDLMAIKKEQYDIVLDLSMNSYASFFMWAIGIKERVGFNFKKRSPFLSTKIDLSGYEDKHVVEYYLGLLDLLKVPVQQKSLEIFPDDKDEIWVDGLFQDSGIGLKDRVVAVVPGGGASWGKGAIYKRWAPEKYAELADKMIEKFNAIIILLGDKNEQSLCEQVETLMKHKCIKMCNQTTLTQLAAIFKKCQLAVLNDGGPLHVAVAAGARTVSIFGPVEDRVYGPYPGDGHVVVKKDIPCRPCYRSFRMADCEHHNCLNLIETQQVLRKVEEIL